MSGLRVFTWKGEESLFLLEWIDKDSFFSWTDFSMWPTFGSWVSLVSPRRGSNWIPVLTQKQRNQSSHDEVWWNEMRWDDSNEKWGNEEKWGMSSCIRKSYIASSLGDVWAEVLRPNTWQSHAFFWSVTPEKECKHRYGWLAGLSNGSRTVHFMFYFN